LDYLETGVPIEKAETARELYVAASRAQRFLAIATPGANPADHYAPSKAVRCDSSDI